MSFTAPDKDCVPFVQHLAKTFFAKLSHRRLYVACAGCFANFELRRRGAPEVVPFLGGSPKSAAVREGEGVKMLSMVLGTYLGTWGTCSAFAGDRIRQAV